MIQQAIKLTIVTERMLLREVVRIIEAAGASGYTVTPASGKGSKNLRSSGDPTVSDNYGNVRIEVITLEPEISERIANEIGEKFFENFSGIIYRDQVEVLRAHRL
jgi:nitrogen regulatory protein PII